MNLKQELLSRNIIVENKYFEMYLDLIAKNVGRPAEKGKTQSHHIIPKYYFKNKNLPIDDSVDNKVNLLYKDHVLAHYYLSLCSSSKYFMFSNLSALNYLLGKNKALKDNPQFLSHLTELQRLYEEYNNERKNFIHLTGVNKTKVWMNNGNKNIRVIPPDIDKFLSLGFKLGCLHRGVEAKVWVNNSISEKMIYASDLRLFLTINKQYHQGRKINNQPRKYTYHKPRTSPTLNTVGISKDGVNKYIPKDLVDNYLSSGWAIGIIKKPSILKHSDRTREKLRLEQKNRIWVTKDNVNKKIKLDDLNNYLQLGYVRGRYVPDKTIFKSKKARVWVTKDANNKSIFSEELDKYISLGWSRGRNTKKIVLKRLENNRAPKKGINKGGKYLIKDGIKKHFYGDDIINHISQGWEVLKNE